MQSQQQPQSSNSQFDFMLKNNQPVKSGGVSKLPKPLVIAGMVVLVIIGLIAFSSFMSGRKNSSYKPMLDTISRGSEIVRVTKVVQKLGLQDPSVAATSNTVLVVLTSDSEQMVNYLANNAVKVSPAQFRASADLTVDTQMKTAQQSNSLDQAYVTYLQQYLPRYQNDLQQARKVAGPQGQDLLKKAIDSENALLATPPLKS